MLCVSLSPLPPSLSLSLSKQKKEAINKLRSNICDGLEKITTEQK